MRPGCDQYATSTSRKPRERPCNPFPTLGPKPRRSPAKLCETVQTRKADDGSRTRGLRLGKPGFFAFGVRVWAGMRLGCDLEIRRSSGPHAGRRDLSLAGVCRGASGVTTSTSCLIAEHALSADCLEPRPACAPGLGSARSRSGCGGPVVAAETADDEACD